MNSQPPFKLVIFPSIQQIFTEHIPRVSTVLGSVEAEMKERKNHLQEAYKGRQAHAKIREVKQSAQVLVLIRGFEPSFYHTPLTCLLGKWYPVITTRFLCLFRWLGGRAEGGGRGKVSGNCCGISAGSQQQAIKKKCI